MDGPNVTQGQTARNLETEHLLSLQVKIFVHTTQPTKNLQILSLYESYVLFFVDAKYLVVQTSERILISFY